MGLDLLMTLTFCLVAAIQAFSGTALAEDFQL
jgi:hypothetical protein